MIASFTEDCSSKPLLKGALWDCVVVLHHPWHHHHHRWFQNGPLWLVNMIGWSKIGRLLVPDTLRTIKLCDLLSVLQMCWEPVQSVWALLRCMPSMPNLLLLVFFFSTKLGTFDVDVIRLTDACLHLASFLCCFPFKPVCFCGMCKIYRHDLQVAPRLQCKY